MATASRTSPSLPALLRYAAHSAYLSAKGYLIREIRAGAAFRRVLARLDLNVPILNGIVQDATRVEAAVPTLRWLMDRAPTVAACSHLGKAAGSPDPALSLEPVVATLQRALDRPVRFAP